MKKRFVIILILFILYLSFNVSAITPQKIKEDKIQLSNGEANIVSSSPIQESQDSISIPNAYSARTSGYTLSNAKDVNIDRATGGMSAKSGDMLIINQLDAEQLKDANLRNRILTLQGAGAVHIKDPIPIDLDEIGPSTFWFEGNDLIWF